MHLIGQMLLACRCGRNEPRSHGNKINFLINKYITRRFAILSAFSPSYTGLNIFCWTIYIWYQYLALVKLHLLLRPQKTIVEKQIRKNNRRIKQSFYAMYYYWISNTGKKLNQWVKWCNYFLGYATLTEKCWHMLWHNKCWQYMIGLYQSNLIIR